MPEETRPEEEETRARKPSEDTMRSIPPASAMPPTPTIDPTIKYRNFGYVVSGLLIGAISLLALRQCGKYSGVVKEPEQRPAYTQSALREDKHRDVMETESDLASKVIDEKDSLSYRGKLSNYDVDYRENNGEIVVILEINGKRYELYDSKGFKSLSSYIDNSEGYDPSNEGLERIVIFSKGEKSVYSMREVSPNTDYGRKVAKVFVEGNKVYTDTKSAVLSALRKEREEAFKIQINSLESLAQ